MPINPVLCSLILTGLSLGGIASSAEPQQELDNEERDPVDCLLIFCGESIESLTLEDGAGKRTQLTRPAARVTLPAGEYIIREVQLLGGFQYRSRAGHGADSFRVCPGTPHELSVGAPLSPTIVGGRCGRWLSLGFRLVDSERRNYSKQHRTDPPTFTVYQHGRKIGSGSFEYG